MKDKFSVVIPVHDCPLAMTERALLSSVSQLRDGDEALLVDACSTVDYTSLCRKLGVRHLRLDEPLMGCETTNIGINSTGNELVHVLHPDDLVLQGFYDRVRSVAETYPKLALYATAHLILAPNGEPIQCMVRDWVGQEGWKTKLHDGNPLAVAACVVRRSFYAVHGVWNTGLMHTSDWELWIRATNKIGAASMHDTLAAYRMHPDNHSSRLARDADNLRDYLALADIVRVYAPHLVEMIPLRRSLAAKAREQAERFRPFDRQAAANNERFALEMEGAVP